MRWSLPAEELRCWKRNPIPGNEESYKMWVTWDGLGNQLRYFISTRRYSFSKREVYFDVWLKTQPLSHAELSGFKTLRERGKTAGQTDWQVDTSLQNHAMGECQRHSKSQKIVTLTHIQFDLRSTCIDWRWVAKRWKNCVDSRKNLSSSVDQSQRKWAAKRRPRKLNASRFSFTESISFRKDVKTTWDEEQFYLTSHELISIQNPSLIQMATVWLVAK